MLFHSREFLAFFLPGTFLVWLVLTLAGKQRIALAWLTISSLGFYSYWNPPYLFLLLGSLAWNFTFGKLVDPHLGRPARNRFMSLCAGVGGNLALLAYFKYAGFFVESINALLHLGWHFEKLLLPLAISFYTFQQVAYLVDSYRGKAKGHSLLEYAFFVTFFPQLIAGPIVHHSELIPQALKKRTNAEIPANVIIGLSIFLIGLFKKFVLADTCGELADPFFDSIAEGQRYSQIDSWCGVLAYGFQIYLDFSGYSDMAIGLGRLFGFVLPENFSAPYRAGSIIEFWRRWHITLSRFLRDYLYIPLGGNRYGTFSRYRNLMLTMLLGGLWHGAGWTFVLWGGLHGVFLSVNHLWRRYAPARLSLEKAAPRVRHVLCWGFSMLCVCMAWVFFRSDSVDSAIAILKSMIGFEPARPKNSESLGEFWRSFLRWPWLCLLQAIVLLAPTTQSYFRAARPTLETSGNATSWWHWRPTFVHAFALGLLLIPVIRRYLSLAPSEFLYFNF